MTKLTDGELIERQKSILFLKGTHSSQTVNECVKDLTMLSKPYNKVLSEKNEILPFEDASSLEFLSSKNECGLFVFGSNTKKRPDNLVIGRVFDAHLLDIFEFGIEQFVGMHDFQGDKKAIGSKPLMVFLGDQWELDSKYMSIQNMLLDLFRGFKPDKINLQGIDHLITCACDDGKIFIRGYHVNYQKASTEVPDLVLKPMGPFLDLSLRRIQVAAEDLFRAACKKPKITSVPNKLKNITRSDKGDKLGRIHMKKQNLDKLSGRRSVALRKSRSDGSSGKKRVLSGAEQSNAKKRKSE